MGRPKVIVVDDDADTREALALGLEDYGFETEEATHGLRLFARLETERPDAIVLDVMMSWMNGFELCEAIKKNPDFADIAVVFVTGRSGKDDVARGLAAGAAGYFTKPLDIEQLARRLRELTEIRRESARPAG